MKTLSVVRIALLLALSGIVSGCHWRSSWPWPGRTENTDGLGDSVIGNYMRPVWDSHFDDRVKENIIKLLKQTPGKGFTRQDAESLGAHCASAPSTECKYVGEAWYRSHGLPETSPSFGKKVIVNIEVSFSYLKPYELVVRKQERLIPDDERD
ncbi:hypothetical protein [Bradyrhizobium sp.]|uniref:hypothetical protein n=1 Tax=Bradyrhizobium sp. TaxID=376 RepID=UPI002D6184AB|nr:hypothetical protein [Bradyrhizobium sp.]HZR74247.1 hypothetical protein [Bradyrhizobium sp.]